MVLSFRDDHRRSPGFKCRENVIEDEIVPCRVFSKPRVKFLDGRLCIGAVPDTSELRASKHHLMVEGPKRRLLFGVNTMTDRTALHEDDWVVAVLPRHRRG